MTKSQREARIDDKEVRVAKVMRVLYKMHFPNFEDVGQPVSQMRMLDKGWVHDKLDLERTARAVVNALSE